MTYNSDSRSNSADSGTIRSLAFFDPEYYRTIHGDLSNFPDIELQTHYLCHGCMEGRPCTPYALREHFKDLLPSGGDVLEIGPFNKPYVTGKNVRYFDVLTRDGLIERGRSLGYGAKDLIGTPVIDYVSPTGDLSFVDRQFEVAVSSHCIEHQSDLIAHLLQVEKLLKLGGEYFLIIPDKRYCFDYYIAETSIADVLCAHVEKRVTHTLNSVIEHRALTTHNDSVRHWRGDHGVLENVVGRVRGALQEYQDAAGGYIDVHSWQFTPSGFFHLTGLLRELGLTKMEPKQVFNTPYGRLEFCAILSRADELIDQ